MVNYWYIKVSSNDRKFNNILKKSQNDKSIGIGYDINRNYTSMTRQDRHNIWNNLGHNDRGKKLRENYFNTFINKMNIGDIVFLTKGEYQILYMAQISSNYYYDESYNGLNNRRHITNIRKFEAIAPKRMLATIYKV